MEERHLEEVMKLERIILMMIFFIIGQSHVLNATSIEIKQNVLPFSCDISESEREVLKNDSSFKEFEESFSKICSIENAVSSLTKEEQYFMDNWGSNFCKALMADPYYYQLKCNYVKVIKNKILNQAEAFAIKGYTEQYYKYLSGKESDGTNRDYKIFNEILDRAISKLNQHKEFQYNDREVYRGTSMGAKNYSKTMSPFEIARVTSSSCVKEIAFGPKTIPMTKEERIAYLDSVEATDEDVWMFESQMIKRDPKFLEVQDTKCKKDYFAENPTIPNQDGQNFGNGNLRLTYLPPLNGKSKRVVIYPLSKLRQEAEVLIPKGTKFKVEDLGQDDLGDYFVILREVE